MKMNYRPIINTRRRAPRPAGLRIPLAFIAAILLLHFFLPRALSGFFSALAEPVWQFGRTVEEGATSLARFVQTKQSLIAENQRLDSEVRQNEIVLAERALLLEENELLKKELGRVVLRQKEILAAVLRTPAATAYDTAVLDIGAQDGVADNDLVFADGVLVGRIAETHSRSSAAEFFTSPGKKIDAVILHSGNALPVVAEGQGNGSFLARLPREVLVSQGDVLALPGLSPLLLGRVAAVIANETEPFQKLYLTNLVNLSTLRFVSVRLASRSE